MADIGIALTETAQVGMGTDTAVKYMLFWHSLSRNGCVCDKKKRKEIMLQMKFRIDM